MDKSILAKAQEWADKYSGILTASAETRFPWLYKGAIGGLEHIISVDNGAIYMEAWRDGSGGYYATTGAAVKQMPGLAKGVALDEALDKFFSLTAKLSKAGTINPMRSHGRGHDSIHTHPDNTQHAHLTGKHPLGPDMPSAYAHGEAGTKHGHAEPGPQHEHGRAAHWAGATGKAVKKGKTKRDRVGHTQPSARVKSPFKKGHEFARQSHGVTGTPHLHTVSRPGDAAENVQHSHSPKAHAHPFKKNIVQKHDTPNSRHAEHDPRSYNNRMAAIHEDHRQRVARGETCGHFPCRGHDSKGNNLPAKKAIRKNIIANDGPQIGPEHSVGHLKPSDLSPESSMKKAIRTLIKQIKRATLVGPSKGGRIGADGAVTPVQMPKPGTPGTGVPANYGSGSRTPRFNYPSAADTAWAGKAMRKAGPHDNPDSMWTRQHGGTHGHDYPAVAGGGRNSRAYSGTHTHKPMQHLQGRHSQEEQAAPKLAPTKKNIVGLSRRGGAGASNSRNPKPHGNRLMTAAEPKHYPFQSEPHGAEGSHSHEYGQGKRGTHTHPGGAMNLPHSDVGTRSDFHAQSMWLKPTKKGLGKECSPCELRKAVLSAGRAINKTPKKVKIPSEAHSEHVYESYKPRGPKSGEIVGPSGWVESTKTTRGPHTQTTWEPGMRKGKSA